MGLRHPAPGSNSILCQQEDIRLKAQICALGTSSQTQSLTDSLRTIPGGFQVPCLCALGASGACGKWTATLALHCIRPDVAARFYPWFVLTC